MTGFGNTKKHKKGKSNGTCRKSRTEEDIKKSVMAYQKGDLQGAKIVLEKTLQSDPANSFVLGFLATIEKALGNYEQALKFFKRSTDISQDNSDILHNYSILLIEEDLKKAISLSNKAVNIFPENSRYLERNGYLKWKAGNLDEALSNNKH